MQKVVVGFGRMNPVSIGHCKMLRLMKQKADEIGADAIYYLSHSYDGKGSGKFKPGKTKNPLSYEAKLDYCRDAAPEITFVESSANNFYAVLHDVYEAGYTECYIYGGEDRIESFDKAKEYNGNLDEDDPNYFDFDIIEAISSGARDEGSKDIEEQASASLLRKLCAERNLEEFRKFAGTKELTDDMYDELSMEMGVDQEELQESFFKSNKFDTTIKKGHKFSVKDEIAMFGKELKPEQSRKVSEHSIIANPGIYLGMDKNAIRRIIVNDPNSDKITMARLDTSGEYIGDKTKYRAEVYGLKQSLEKRLDTYGVLLEDCLSYNEAKQYEGWEVNAFIVNAMSQEYTWSCFKLDTPESDALWIEFKELLSNYRQFYNWTDYNRKRDLATAFNSAADSTSFFRFAMVPWNTYETIEDQTAYINDAYAELDYKTEDQLRLEDKIKRQNGKHYTEDTHSLHIEDSILKGADFFKREINFFNQALSLLEGSSTGQPSPSCKIDGSPALTFGSSFPGFEIAANGFVSTKSIFNKNAKIYTTHEDIDRDDRPEGLKAKLHVALELAWEGIIPDGEIWQGDLLWTQGDAKTFNEDGESFVYVKPNTLVYAAPAGSDLAEAMVNKRIGLIFHTRYTGTSIQNVKQSNDADASRLRNIPDWAFVMDAKLPNLSGKISWTKKQSELMREEIDALKDIYNKLKDDPDYDTLCRNEEFVQFYVMTLQNQKIDKKESIDADKFVDELHQHITKRMRKNYQGLDKLKTKKGRDSKRSSIKSVSEKLHDIVENNAGLIRELALGLEKATEIKAEVLDKMQQASDFITAVEKRNGSFERTSGEGIMISDIDGNFVKLVDRSAFSYYNRSNDVVKGWEHPKSLQESFYYGTGEDSDDFDDEDEEYIEDQVSSGSDQDEIVLVFDKEDKAELAVQTINADAKKAGLQESVLREADIPEDLYNPRVFKTQRDSNAFMDEIEAKYGLKHDNDDSKSDIDYIVHSKNKYTVAVKKIRTRQGTIEVKAEKIPADKRTKKDAQNTIPAELPQNKKAKGSKKARETVPDGMIVKISEDVNQIQSDVIPLMTRVFLKLGDKSLGLGFSLKGGHKQSKSTALLNIFQKTGGAILPLSEGVIQEAFAEILKPGSMDRTFGQIVKPPSGCVIGINFQANNEQRVSDSQLKIGLRQTGASSKSQDVYIFESTETGFVLNQGQTVKQFTTRMNTQISEALTAYFLAEAMAERSDYENVVAFFNDAPRAIDFISKNINCQGKNAQWVAERYPVFSSLCGESIAVICSQSTVKQIKSCYNKFPKSVNWIPIHESLIRGHKIFDYLKAVPQGSADSINPTDIYLINKNNIKNFVKYNKEFKSFTDNQLYKKAHNELFDNLSIIPISLKKLNKESLTAKKANISIVHNSLSSQMNGERVAYFTADTFQKVSLSKPSLLPIKANTPAPGNSVSCYINAEFNPDNKIHIHTTDDSLHIDIRSFSSKANVYDPPGFEAVGRGLRARLGKCASSISKMFPSFKLELKNTINTEFGALLSLPPSKGLNDLVLRERFIPVQTSEFSLLMENFLSRLNEAGKKAAAASAAVVSKDVRVQAKNDIIENNEEFKDLIEEIMDEYFEEEEEPIKFNKKSYDDGEYEDIYNAYIKIFKKLFPSVEPLLPILGDLTKVQKRINKEREVSQDIKDWCAKLNGKDKKLAVAIRNYLSGKYVYELMGKTEEGDTETIEEKRKMKITELFADALKYNILTEEGPNDFKIVSYIKIY